VTVGLGYLVTEVLPSTALGKWDADVPRRLVEYREQEGVSESKLITSLSETPTIVALTAIAAAVFRWKFDRWRESLVVIYAVVGETSIFMATTLLIDRPRPSVPKLDAAPPTCRSRQATPPPPCASTAHLPRSSSGIPGIGGSRP
jgi:undecaprenyl-diphosphatase